MESAIEQYYAARIRLPEDFRADIRAMVDEAVADNFSLTDEMREQYQRRLDTLDKKESYLLDLAAEEGWPKEKLREKIGSIRKEREQIEAELSDAKKQLDTGKGVFYRALELLENPAEAYATGDEVVRSTLNKAFVSRFMIEGVKVVEGELKEPFDTLLGAYEHDEVRVYLREVGHLPQARTNTRGGRGRAVRRQIATCPTLRGEDGGTA
jgi:hypothetical protein